MKNNKNDLYIIKNEIGNVKKDIKKDNHILTTLENEKIKVKHNSKKAIKKLNKDNKKQKHYYRSIKKANKKNILVLKENILYNRQNIRLLKKQFVVYKKSAKQEALCLRNQLHTNNKHLNKANKARLKELKNGKKNYKENIRYNKQIVKQDRESIGTLKNNIYNAREVMKNNIDVNNNSVYNIEQQRDDYLIENKDFTKTKKKTLKDRISFYEMKKEQYKLEKMQQNPRINIHTNPTMGGMGIA